ncbi:NAD-dependent epimerase/dehydratase family protein [Actinomycetospora atypica]|uniref:NAD-dependent epimerase/dehydratase family protein n=1 Tax=Actinomycetospora atypica TaxID=1290095 RepID=A0ABV9YSR7_9PSEU
MDVTGRWLVTGSSGHLGEALVRVLRERGGTVAGLDVAPSPTTDHVASVTDRAALADATAGVDHVLHTATLHKPHVGTHSRQAFVDVNVTGTLAVLDAARDAGVRSVVVTSSTSAFGRALTPAPGEPAAWITEDVAHRIRNVYGATKTAAEDLAELAAADGLPVVVLRTSRFFPEPDDRDEARARYDDANLKAVEYLYRRVAIDDVVDAHLLAAARAPALGFARFVVSATTPFVEADREELGRDAPAVVARLFPELSRRFAERGWMVPPALDRVYVNTRARTELGWSPRWDFPAAAGLALAEGHVLSPLARVVGAKGYHDRPTGIYTR